MPRSNSIPDKDSSADSNKMSETNSKSSKAEQRANKSKSNQQQQTSNESEQSTHESLENSAEQPSQLNGLDLSKYRQPKLVDALDRLTSFTYAGSLLLKPALKIMWRSAIYQDAEVRLQDLVTKLKGAGSIMQPPTESVTEERKEQINKAQQNKPASQTQQQQQARRSLVERITHFFFIGLPLAVLVGLAYGCVNFVTCIWSDVFTVASLSQKLFETAKTDLNYYYKHPESRPTRNEAIDAWSAQIIAPYTRTIIQKKLGPFGFISGPVSNLVTKFVRRSANIAATEAEKYGKTRGFTPFRPTESAQAS